MRNIYARNSLRGPEGSVSLACPYTVVYDADNDLIWEYETDWTRSASSDMCTFSAGVPMQTLFYKVISILFNTLKLIMNLVEVAKEFTSKNTDLTQFFIIKPTHPGQLKNRSGWKKPSGGALVTCGKTPTTVIWSGLLKIYCTLLLLRSKRQRVQQSASKFCNLPLLAKDRTWTKCAVALSVSEASRSRLRPDGPHVHLSDVKRNFWLAKNLTSRHVRMHRVIRLDMKYAEKTYG